MKSRFFFLLAASRLDLSQALGNPPAVIGRCRDRPRGKWVCRRRRSSRIRCRRWIPCNKKVPAFSLAAFPPIAFPPIAFPPIADPPIRIA
jgi:hypothetical protein